MGKYAIFYEARYGCGCNRNGYGKAKGMILLQTLSPFPSPLILTRQNLTIHSISLTQLSVPSKSCPKIPSNYENLSSRTGTALRSNLRDNDPVQESAFFDENGAVEDMDGYLNYLSLEYDSVWDTKPSW